MRRGWLRLAMAVVGLGVFAAAPLATSTLLLLAHSRKREYAAEREGKSRRLLSTHPPIGERIDRLVEMAGRPVERHHLGRLRP